MRVGRVSGRRVFTDEALAMSPLGRWIWVVLETVLFCVGAVVVGYWAIPADPFGLHLQFPWLWIVPAVLAMRYGTGSGAGAVVVLVLCWVGASRYHVLPDIDVRDFPKVYFLGGLILTLICGQFSDVWSARGRRVRAINSYLDERLNTLTKNHFLLRLSHQRLEQDLLAKPLTLRETLLRLRELTNANPRTPTTPLPAALEFMQLLGQSCQLEVAAVYAFDHSGLPQQEPAAQLGRAAALDAQDPLYRYALEQNLLAHVQTAAATESIRDASRYLICAPLQASGGAPVGVLVVERLPFFALNEEALQLLSVLIGYYADGLQMTDLIHAVSQRVPECPPEMALDLVRLHHIYETAGIVSSLVALVFENDDTAVAMLEQVRRLKRGVDLSWELVVTNRRVLITLLPLAGSAAVEGYLLRLEAALQSQFGKAALSHRVVTHVVQLGSAAPVEVLAKLVDRCAV